MMWAILVPALIFVIVSYSILMNCHTFDVCLFAVLTGWLMNKSGTFCHVFVSTFSLISLYYLIDK